MDTDDGVFDDSPKISDHFQNIFEDSPKLQWSHERCRTFSGNVRRLPKNFEEDPKMFRSYANELKYILRDKLDISEIIDRYCKYATRVPDVVSYEFYEWCIYVIIIHQIFSLARDWSKPVT